MLSWGQKMEGLLARAAACGCGARHETPIRRIVIEREALSRLAEYVREEQIARLALVCDSRTWEAAGSALQERLLHSGVTGVDTIKLQDHANGEIVADEAAIVETLLGLKPDVEAVAAVGSGTIHDIVRFVCHRSGRRFLSVPTAPSVDGFSSVGAPLILRGFKQTVAACAPEAIFADLNVLSRAPQAMIAAGFGDMLGKYTSLADWQLGAILTGEPYCEECAGLTREALELCVRSAAAIGAREERGLQTLTDGLIASGISILLFGNSRPASGAEHHLSHFWEMRFLTEGRRALLHGAKVGAASVIAAGLYAKLARILETATDEELAAAVQLDAAADRKRIAGAFGAIAGEVEAESFPGGRAPFDTELLRERLVAQRGRLLAVVRTVPGPQRMAELLAAVGGATQPDELGIEPALVHESLASAHYVRNRLTVLKLLHLLAAAPAAENGHLTF